MKITHTELFLYLADELSADERVEFEKALAQSPEAQQALAELRKQDNLLAQLPLQEPSRDLVAAALAQVKPRKHTVRWHFPAPLLAAAALLVLLSGLFWGIHLRRGPEQIAQGPTPSVSEIPVGDQVLGARIAQLRSAIRKSPAPSASPRAAVIPDPAPALVASVKTRLSDLQARCRPQMASAPATPAPGEAPLDRRMQRIKSGMDFIREDIWASELPASVQAALEKSGPLWPALPLSTIISPIIGVSHSEGRRIRPDCGETVRQWKERNIT
jgi:anti-sigma factor RsiW